MKINISVYNTPYFNYYKQNHNLKPFVSIPQQNDTVSFSGKKAVCDIVFEKCKKSFIEKLYQDKRIPKEDIEKIDEMIEKDTLSFAETLYNDKDFPDCQIYDILGDIFQYDKLKDSARKGYKYYAKMFNQCINNPKDYINGFYDCPSSAIEDLFHRYNVKIIELSGLQDSELNNFLLRKRTDGFCKYLKFIDGFYKNKKYAILEKAIKCTNPDGKALNAKQKAEIINLLESYKLTHADLSEISKQVESGIIDIQGLKKDLLNLTMRKYGYTKITLKEIPKEKLYDWDMDYIHLLAPQIETNPITFKDLIIMANNAEDFKSQIQSLENLYGKINKKTENRFKKIGVNYKKWLTPSKDNEVRLKVVDKNFEQVKQFAGQFIQSVEDLRQTPVKKFIDKKYPVSVAKGNFTLPNEIFNNKTKLYEFMKNFINELKPVWQRAELNAQKDDIKIKEKAQKTLTIKSHITTLINGIENIKETNKHNEVDLTIKMWNRIPQHDLFQGNYSTCCIGLGEHNGKFMPDYLLNSAFNMIEIVDNQTNRTVGNALCYYAQNNQMKPVLIIDNIEINNSYKPSDQVCKNIRDSVALYAKNLNKEVTGNDDIPVYIGDNYNDVPTYDLETIEDEFITFAGKLEAEEIYLDAFNGLINSNNIRKNVTLKKLL